MLYQLPTGKVIEITTEQFVEMSDEELEYLIAYNYGENLENPWFGSVLHKGSIEFPEEVTPELLDVSQEEKYIDLDVEKDLIDSE